MYLQRNTLEYYKSKPVFLFNDLSNIKMSSILPKVKGNLDSAIKVKPEECALEFYLGNHIHSELKSKYNTFVLLGVGDPLVSSYIENVLKHSIRMFMYLLLICTRESRHVYSCMDWKSHTEKYGKVVTDFTKSISNTSSSGSVTKLFLYDFKDVTLGTYTESLNNIFKEGEFSGGYGGSAWHDISSVLNNYVQGVYTAELMLDTAFTLCHNNGPIFNKGLFYNSYSESIYEILDVQRSGQIPQYVSNESSSYITPSMKAYAKKSTSIFRNLDTYVDWYRVEDMGALKSYDSKKEVQCVVHGKPICKYKPVKEKLPVALDYDPSKYYQVDHSTVVRLLTLDRVE